MLFRQSTVQGGLFAQFILIPLVDPPDFIP